MSKLDNIAVFGSKWSYGQTVEEYKANLTGREDAIPKEDYDNWVKRMAKSNPESNIRNYSVPNCSLLLQNYIRHNTQLSRPIDLFVMEPTTDHVTTVWPEGIDFDAHMVQRTDNYWEFDNTLFDKLQNIAKVGNIEMFEAEQQALCEYNRLRVDILFANSYMFHTPSLQHMWTQRWSVLTITNDNMFSGMGMKATEQYVYEKLSGLANAANA